MLALNCAPPVRYGRQSLTSVRPAHIVTRKYLAFRDREGSLSVILQWLRLQLCPRRPGSVEADQGIDTESRQTGTTYPQIARRAPGGLELTPVARRGVRRSPQRGGQSG